MVPQALKGLKVQVPQGPQCTKTGVSRASKWYLKGLSAPKLVSQGSQSAGASRASVHQNWCLKGLKVVPQGPQCTKTGVSRVSKCRCLKGLPSEIAFQVQNLISKGSSGLRKSKKYFGS